MGSRSVTVHNPVGVFRRHLSAPVQESVGSYGGASQEDDVIQPSKELVLHRSYRTCSQLEAFLNHLNDWTPVGTELSILEGRCSVS